MHRRGSQRPAAGHGTAVVLAPPRDLRCLGPGPGVHGGTEAAGVDETLEGLCRPRVA